MPKQFALASPGVVAPDALADAALDGERDVESVVASGNEQSYDVRPWCDVQFDAATQFGWPGYRGLLR